MAEISTSDLRRMARLAAISGLRRTIAAVRDTARWPDVPAGNGYLARRVNVVLCARHIAVMRAEIARRERESAARFLVAVPAVRSV